MANERNLLPYKLILIFLFTLMCSVGGILYAIYWSHNQADGGRGGALGAAVALSVLVLSRKYPISLYRKLTNGLGKVRQSLSTMLNVFPSTRQPDRDTTKSVQENVDTLRGEISELVDKLETDESELNIQNFFLAATTAVATLTWGFGDVIAGWMIPSSAPTLPLIHMTKFECFEGSEKYFSFSDGTADITPDTLKTGLDAVSDWADKNNDDAAHLVGIIVIGSADKRTLSPQLKERYGDNTGLAMARARAIATGLEGRHFVSRSSIATFYAGPTIFGYTKSNKDTAGDRVVRICGIWG